MRLTLPCCLHYPQPVPPPPPITTKRKLTSPFHRSKAVTSVSSSSDKSWRCLHKFLLRATAGALSFSLLFFPFRSLAEVAGLPAVQLPSRPLPPPSELCQDWAEEGEEEAEVPPESITNEGLVEEAWEVVNESFLGDAVSRSWSPEKWLVD